MKIGDRVWVRVGLDRHPVQGTLVSIDLANDTGEVWLHGRKVLRVLKRIHSTRPKSERDKLANKEFWRRMEARNRPRIFRPQ